jgi:hypothetical protein
VGGFLDGRICILRVQATKNGASNVGTENLIERQ